MSSLVDERPRHAGLLLRFLLFGLAVVLVLSTLTARLVYGALLDVPSLHTPVTAHR